MHVVYSCFPTCAESLHSEFISLWIEWSTLVAAETFFCTCVLNDNFLFSQTLNHLTWVLDFITVLFNRVISAVGSLLALEKWINSNLLSLNCTAFSSAHVNTVFAASCSTFAFSSAVFSDFFFFLISSFSVCSLRLWHFLVN